MNEYSLQVLRIGRSCQTLHVGSVFQWLVSSIHEMSARRPMDSCPVIDPALNLRDIDAVIWRENICLQCLGTSPLLGVRTRFPRTRRMRGTRRRHISVLPCMRN
ncbi:putative surface protease GP63 [Trypanosoma cruzi]|nr:putative surface protease GP63 [Trypanosoma cruzi]